MFGLFRKKKPPSPRPEPDRVYLTARARNNAAASACLLAAVSRPRVALVTPFRGHLRALRDELSARGLATHLLEGAYRTEGAAAGAVPLVDAASFVSVAPGLSQGEPLEVFQIERHPLRAHDEAVLASIAALPKGSRLHVYLSLDDGLFRIFGGSVQELCRKLGMPEDEAIEHPMVASSIENAQEKIRKKIESEVPADTFDQWRALNLPGH